MSYAATVNLRNRIGVTIIAIIVVPSTTDGTRY
jgi:hypothetical protein